jgi:hypothetical protein
MFSQNGYRANDRTLIAAYTVPTTDIRVALRKGDVSVVLLYVLEEFHLTVQPLRKIDTGGYAERVIRGGVSLSNHASGTAIDARWNDHPLGRRGTFTSAQVRAIRDILEFCGRAVRWGGDYITRADEMHFEIVAPPAKVAQVAEKIRAYRQGKAIGNAITRGISAYAAYPGHPLRRGMTNNKDVRTYQTQMKHRGWRRMSVDGDFGRVTEDLTRQFQHEKGLVVDGRVGPKTWKAAFTAQ